MKNSQISEINELMDNWNKWNKRINKSQTSTKGVKSQLDCRKVINGNCTWK